MAKQTAPAGHKAQRAARTPSKGTVTKPTTQAPAPVLAALPTQAPTANAPATMAALLAANAQRGAPAPAPATQAPAPAAPVVAVRGGLAIATVRLTGKVYRVGAAHNAAWWQQCTQAVAAGGGTASVAALVQAGVPAIFVGYVVRRGYMAGA